MCTLPRLFPLVLATALIGCGGGNLTLPDDNAPAALLPVSGNGQQGTVGRRLDDPLVVKLTDASSRPISGVAVVFQFTNDVPDAEVDPAEATTDSDGLASARVRLGSSTGPHQIEAQVASPAALSATFVVTALERERNRGGGGGDDDDD